MKKNIFLIQMIVLIFAGITHAGIIYTESWDCTGIPPRVGGNMGFRITGQTGTNTTIFDTLSIPFSDAGIIFSGKQDPDYNNFVSMITNGVNDPLFYCVGLLFWSGTETQRWFNSSPPPGRVDFQGYQIDDITVVFSSKTITELTPHQAWDTCNFTIYGQPVPEPTTVFLTLMGGLIFVWQRNRNHISSPCDQ
jgi:hypothetical protein